MCQVGSPAVSGVAPLALQAWKRLRQLLGRGRGWCHGRAACQAGTAAVQMALQGLLQLAQGYQYIKRTLKARF